MFFKKLETDIRLSIGNIIYGPFGQFTLTDENKESYEYPVDGWYWFATEDEARVALNWSKVQEQAKIDELKSKVVDRRK